MHAKKLPPNGSNSALRPPSPHGTPGTRHEPDLSHLATRKVDSVSSLAAEMMLRQADEEAAAQAPAPTWSTMQPLRPVAVELLPREGVGLGGGRVVLLVVAGLLLVAMSAAAAFVLTR